MKKYLLLRLLAFILMCLSSLLIKSETTICNLHCTSFTKSALVNESLKTTAEFNPVFHDDGFFIKI